jgi:hypothetical protein
MNITPETQAMAQAVLDYIHEHPEDHDQATFWRPTDCGTSMCIAGTALNIAYGVTCVNDFFDIVNPEPTNEVIGISDAAGRLLGLENPAEHDLIFYEYNNEAAIQQLKHLVTGDATAFMSHTNTSKEADDE